MARLAAPTAAGKRFTVFYIFAGLGIVVGFVTAVKRALMEQGRWSRGLLGRSLRGAESVGAKGSIRTKRETR
jgi:hypothetical protein